MKLDYEKLYEDQVRNEFKCYEQGRHEYLQKRAEVNGHVERDRTLVSWINKHMKVMTQAIVDKLAHEKEAHPTRKSKGYMLCKETLPDELAYYTLRYFVSADVIMREPSVIQVSMALGNYLEESMNYHKIRTDYQKLQRVRVGITEKDGRLYTSKRILKDKGLPHYDLSKTDKAKAGIWLLDIVLTVFPYWDLRTVRTGKHEKKIIETTDVLLKWLDEADNYLARSAGLSEPMVHPPRPWTSSRCGGYLNEDLQGNKNTTLIRTFNKRYLKTLDSVDLTRVLDSINAVQATPWRINKDILEILEWCWDQKIPLGSDGKELMPRYEPTIPPGIPEGYTYASYKEEHPIDFKKLMTFRATTFKENMRARSKRFLAKYCLGIAKRYKDREAIWFPHNADFRLRIYPIPTLLNPQGSDLSKGLLEFAEGKRLGEDGAYWLHVHAANCWGVDKVSNAERVEWTQRNIDAILDSAMNPKDGMCFWMEADKPVSALAVAFELLKYQVHGDDLVSHLPVYMDGTCNGLQHFSAMLRDEVGAKATNLIPQDKPNDIYAQVANIVKDKAEMAAHQGDQWANAWVPIITRSTVKQPVMTLPYGATLRGMSGQLEEWLKKNSPMLFTYTDTLRACNWLAKVTYDSIGEVVQAAILAMNYLQGVARVLAKLDKPVSWVTPIGFPVLQYYMKFDSKRFQASIKGKKITVSISTDTYSLDRGRQGQGIAPNFVHSGDSSHLLLTVLLAKQQGIDSFAMVHDSYGTHASDVSVLHACIREAFVEMYSPNVLQEFHENIKKQLDDEDIVLLPEPPMLGNLDLETVKDSEYFFN